METLDIIIMIAGIGYSFLLIELIDHYGISIKIQMLLLTPVIAVAIVFLFLAIDSPFLYFDYGCLITPVVIVLLYNLLNLLSWKIHDREFRLWIRGAKNLKYYQLYGRKDIYSWTDTLFSFILIFTLMGFAALFAVLLNRILN